MSKCYCCNDYISNTKEYCDFCDKLYFKAEKLRQREKKVPDEKPKNKTSSERICENCKGIYKRINARQRYCCKECRISATPSFADQWLNKKKPKKPDPYIFSKTAIIKDDQGWMRRFNHVRG